MKTQDNEFLLAICETLQLMKDNFHQPFNYKEQIIRLNDKSNIAHQDKKMIAFLLQIILKLPIDNVFKNTCLSIISDFCDDYKNPTYLKCISLIDELYLLSEIKKGNIDLNDKNDELL